MKKSYQFYEDPGHGWLKVERSELKRLGIADKISCYSYQRGGKVVLGEDGYFFTVGGNVYLEEDGDLSTFMDAKNKVDGIGYIECKITENHTNQQSKIRSYHAYQS